jgi:hypothetical protein
MPNEHHGSNSAARPGEFEQLLQKAKQARNGRTLGEFLRYLYDQRSARALNGGPKKLQVAEEVGVDKKTLWERWPDAGKVTPEYRRAVAKALVFDNRDDVPQDHLLQAQELFAEAVPPVAEDSVVAYLARIDLHFKAHDAFSKPLSLSVAVGGRDGTVLPAEKGLQDWLADPKAPRLCFLTGEPGSGKTYLLDWLASHVSRQARGSDASPVPVALSLGRTGTRPPTDKRTLRSCCEHEPPESLLLRLPDQQALLLLDGLDQSRNIELELKPEAYVNLIEGLDRLFARRARIVITCRTVDLERLRVQIESRIDSCKLCVLPVDEQLVDDHFASTEAAAQWSRWRGVPEVQKWSRTPFNIRLLELVLSRPGDRATGDLFELYDGATRQWLHDALDGSYPRGGYEFPDNVVDHLILGLRNIASPNLREPIDEAGFRCCLRSGILRMTKGGLMAFDHPSLWEFFLAMAVRDELETFRSESIARLNLIAYYNVNRFLIPGLLALPRLPARIDARPINGSVTRPISVGEYRAFCKRTSWRASSGHGVHPTAEGKDGLPAASGPTANYLGARPATTSDDGALDHELQDGVSWYDAFVFARSTGGTISTHNEVLEAGQLNLGGAPWAFWCLDWFDERKAHVEVVGWDGRKFEVHGRNPDYRNKNLGFCVTYKEQAS